MAIRVAGIAIDSNFEKDINQLSLDLNWTIEKIENDTFESALSIFFSEDKSIFYVLFTDDGTLIITPLEVARRGFDITDSNFLRFFYESTSMTFLFSYHDDKVNLREIWESDGERNFELGEPLPFENEHPNTSSLISRVTRDLIGVPFDSIDPQESVYKCTKKVTGKYKTEKKWWQIWK